MRPSASTGHKLRGASVGPSEKLCCVHVSRMTAGLHAQSHSSLTCAIGTIPCACCSSLVGSHAKVGPHAAVLHLLYLHSHPAAYASGILSRLSGQSCRCQQKRLVVGCFARPMPNSQVAAIRALSCKSVLSHIFTSFCFACGPLHASAYVDEVDAHFQSCLV